MDPQPSHPLVRCGDIRFADQKALFKRYDLDLNLVEHQSEIPGSFWGPPEAGLIENRLFVRQDTPVHSMFHEAAHYICMDVARRDGLDTDAGGDYDEENAVCYLQILLADHLNEYNRDQMMRDMDAWGYTFRLGSAGAWFHNDAADAAEWLHTRGLIDADGHPTWRLNQGHAY